MADARQLRAWERAGYARTSNASGMVSRIDRKDWREHMAQQHSPHDWQGAGMAWVKLLGKKGAADHYRRCYSNDNLIIGSAARKLPPSADGPTEFRPVAQHTETK